MRSPDVAVIGAGIIGGAIALELARRGARVCLLERDAPGSAASGGAAGMLAPWSEADGPGAFVELAASSARRWPEYAARLREDSGIDPELEPTGLLRLAADTAEASRLRDRLGWLGAAGVVAEWIDADRLAALEPAAAGWWGALLHPEEAHVHSGRSCAAQAEAARRLGVEVRAGAEVVGTSGGALRLAGGSTLVAGAAVIAAGPWSGRLAAALGAPAPPIEPVRGQLLTLSGLDPSPRRILYAGRQGYALTKRDGTVVVGATEEQAGFRPAVTAAAGRRLRRTAVGLLRPSPARAAASSWAALRPRSPDGLPVLGTLDAPGGPARLCIATGHHRNGVLLAPVTAQGIADLVLDGAAPAAWERFAPQRFGPPSG